MKHTLRLKTKQPHWNEVTNQTNARKVYDQLGQNTIHFRILLIKNHSSISNNVKKKESLAKECNETKKQEKEQL